MKHESNRKHFLLLRAQLLIGLMHFRNKNYAAAFDAFTLALFIDESNNVAMEHRAQIHFKKGEFEECVIECEQILKTKSSDEIELLKQNAKKKIPADKPWHEVLQVSPNAAREEVERSFRSIAKVLSPNARHNRKLLKVDQIKIQQKMATLNKAKTIFERTL